MKEFFIGLISYWILCLMIDIYFKRKNIEILQKNIETIQDTIENEKKIIEYNRKINKRIDEFLKKIGG